MLLEDAGSKEACEVAAAEPAVEADLLWVAADSRTVEGKSAMFMQCQSIQTVAVQSRWLGVLNGCLAAV